MKKKERNEYKQALETYQNQCAICKNNKVELHHIIYRGYGLTIKENLIPLCKKCHMEIHSNQKYWTDVLLDMNRDCYGEFDKNDLKRKGKYDGFKY